MTSACLPQPTTLESSFDALSLHRAHEMEEFTVEALLCQVRSGTPRDRKTALEAFLSLLEHDKEGCINALLDMDALPILVDCLHLIDDSISQYAALMIFANVTSGTKEQNQAVINSGAVLSFIQLMDVESINLSEQALICVGNIACEDAFNRKVLYENGGLHAVLRFLNRDDLESETLNSGVWAFSNLCRCRTLISMDDLEPCVNTIKRLLKMEDPEILRNACAATAYLTDGCNDRVQRFLDRGIAPKIIQFTHHTDPFVVYSALRAVSSFLSGTDAQIEVMVDLDVTSGLAHAFKKHSERRIVKEACMSLSNIAAGSQTDILKIIEADLIDDLIRVARHAPMDVRIEAIWTIGNAIIGSGHQLIREFLKPECMKVLSAALTSKNPAVLKLGLQAIRNFLWCGDFAEDPNIDLSEWDSENDQDFWEHAQWLSDAHGFVRLARLRQHPEPEIANLAFDLLEALIEDPCADYAVDDVEESCSSDEEIVNYQDALALGSIFSPTASRP